jgi:hypothetical protein
VPQIISENTPTTTVYDIFAETASQLIGSYVDRSQRATTQDERAEMWKHAMAVRDTKRDVPARDRKQLIDHINVWQREIAQLDGGGRGPAG